jgi:hypothetical protein
MLGDKLHNNNKKKIQQQYRFLGGISLHDVLYSCFEGVLTFNEKKTYQNLKLLKKSSKSTTLYL